MYRRDDRSVVKQSFDNLRGEITAILRAIGIAGTQYKSYTMQQLQILLVWQDAVVHNIVILRRIVLDEGFIIRQSRNVQFTM